MTTRTARPLVRFALCATLVLGAAAAGLVAASSLEPGAAAAPVDAPVLSPEEAELVAHMDPDDRARYLLQRELAERAELAALLSQVQELRHRTALNTINNIR
jgi:hypothetical protein